MQVLWIKVLAIFSQKVGYKNNEAPRGRGLIGAMPAGDAGLGGLVCYQ